MPAADDTGGAIVQIVAVHQPQRPATRRHRVAADRPQPRADHYDVVHVNSEFADQVSDHDPQVTDLTVP